MTTRVKPGNIPGKTKATFYLDATLHQALRVKAAETGESQSDIAERAIRRELGMVELTWEVIEDNGGGLHLVVFEGGDVIYYADGYEHMVAMLRDDLEALRGGDDTRGWEMQVDDAQAAYDALTSHEHGWTVVADQDGVYYDRMGAAALRALGISDREFVAEGFRRGDWDTTYGDGYGNEHEAIQIPWSDLERILGRPHEGGPEEDIALIEALIASGGPEWLRDAAGWTDEHGWGLYGPEIKEGD